MEPYEDTKLIFIEILDEIHQKVEMALNFYDKIRDEVSDAEFEKFKVYESTFGNIEFLTKSSLDPTKYLREIMDLIEWYKDIIKNFTTEELAAFLLGLGFEFVDLPFWGIEQTNKNILKTQESLEYYENTFKKIGSFEKEAFYRHSSKPYNVYFLPARDIDPIPYLKIIKKLFQSQLDVIINYPFA